ncbi:MAG: multiheme c-type cytochrome [Candidatus Brocadiales bacterium]
MDRLRNPRFILSLIIIVLFIGCITTVQTKTIEAKRALLSTQKFFAELRGEKIESDDSGILFRGGGLTATYSGPEELFPAYGKYGKLFSFMPLIRWYDPDHYFSGDFHPGSPVQGEYENDECVLCHSVQTPGIVAQWKRSEHASPPWGKEVVGCDRCHGNDHQKLRMPSYNTCGECHKEQMNGHRAGAVGSHAHAYRVSVLEAAWQIEKPAEEVSACATCHAIAENRCDGCHTRHDFSLAEARKPNNCGVCHTGLDHYEYEMYMQSYHGMLYQAGGALWGWIEPLKPENYKAPTCAYCHMQGGEHNVMKTATIHSNMGTSLVDRGAPQFKAKRDGWVKLCQGCHSPRFARDQLEAVDEAVKVSFTKYREAMGIVASLYQEGVLDPMPEDLAPDWTGHYTFSVFPGGEGRMHNSSEIERLSFELLVYITNAVYKAMSHFAWYNATYGLGAFKQDRWLTQIKAEASRLRRFAAIESKLGITHEADEFWKHGEYTDLLLGWKIKEGKVTSGE